jgi:AraC-like DNA-binding protein
MLTVKRWPVSPRLARHLGEILHVRGTAGPPDDSILPDIHAADLALHLGDPGQLQDGGAVLEQPRRLVVGGRSRAMGVRHGAFLDTVFLALPPGCACLLGVPAAALRDVVAPLESIAPALDASLRSWADAYRDGRAAAPELDEVLLAALRPRCDRLVREIAEVLSAPSAPPISSLATSFELSRRQLDRRFGDAMGRSPRELRRLARFARAWRIASEGRVQSWAALAADAGYFDQAHCNHDFRALAGASPRAVFSESWYAAFHPAGLVVS